MDAAAVNIIQHASPYEPFTQEICEKTDILYVIYEVFLTPQVK
jgi:hypothetical protein